MLEPSGPRSLVHQPAERSLFSFARRASLGSALDLLVARPRRTMPPTSDTIAGEFLACPVQLADQRSSYDSYVGHLRRLTAKRAQVDNRSPHTFPQTSNRNFSNPHSKPKPTRRSSLGRRPHSASPIHRPAWDESTVLYSTERTIPQADVRGRETSRSGPAAQRRLAGPRASHGEDDLLALGYGSQPYDPTNVATVVPELDYYQYVSARALQRSRRPHRC